MKETADGGALTCGREQNADSLAEDGKNIEIKRMIKENIMKSNAEISINNIYRLDGRVPLGKAIPFGLQHVLAMFVANLTPIVIVTAAAGLETSQTAALIQNAMFIAGVATLIQLYPVWRIGAKLPIVMGVSFTFVTILSSVGAKYGYPAILGAILIGGLVEGTLGLFAKYWRKLISPIVSACVVTSIGFSLLTVGARSFGGGYSDSFGSATNLLIGTVTLLSCILFNVFAKSFWEAAVCSVWTGCRLCTLDIPGRSGSVGTARRRDLIPSPYFTVYAGVSCGRNPVCGCDLSRIGN